MIDFRGQVAVVTGAGRGIGEAVARALAGLGAAVIALDLDGKSAEQVAGDLPSTGPGAIGLACDITKADDIAAAVERGTDEFGAPDVLINNAGVNAYGDAVEMTEAEWDTVFAVDLKGAWLCSRAVLTAMRARKRGSIVNIASIHASLTTSGMFPYAAAKAGLVGFTRTLALDEAKYDIRVNAVSPGWTRTHLVDEWLQRQPDPQAVEEQILQMHPLRRLATPDEIAQAVAFVASDAASFMTGAELKVDGGLSATFRA